MRYCVYTCSADGSDLFGAYKDEPSAIDGMLKLASENKTSWAADGIWAEVWACDVEAEAQDHKGYMGLIYHKLELVERT